MVAKTVEVLHPDLLPPREFIDKRVDELLDLRGKRAVVAGGGGPNLGQAIVHRLAGLGASVVVVDRAADAARKVASEAQERWGVDALPIEADLTDWDETHRVAHDVAEQLGGIDIWVNSGGSGGRSIIDFADLTHAEMDGFIGWLTPPLYGTHAALEVMVPQNRGRIVNISSVGGLTAVKGAVVYGAIKAAIIAFTEFVAPEIGPKGVTIACVAPGTMLGDGFIELLSGSSRDQDASAEYFERVWNRTSIGRCCYPEEVANMVAFLASDAGAYVHGTTVRVAGGL